MVGREKDLIAETYIGVIINDEDCLLTPHERQLSS